MAGEYAPFDRKAVRAHRDRAAAGFEAADFLFRETAARLVDRLADVRRDFPNVLDLGGHTGALAARLEGRRDVERVFHCDLSPAMAHKARAATGLPAVAADEEALPFAEASFDLVASNLSLHWVNDLPGALIQINRALRPDGLFLACLLGGRTLHELRDALTEAELGVEGGVSPRVSPFADVRDGGDLLARAGFALPVADLDTIRVSFESPLHLMRDLRAMGEANAVAERRRGPSRRTTLMEAARRYADAAPAGEAPESRVAATFDVIWLTGWAPGPGQPKPLAPGSARTRLADALDAVERPAGDTAPRPKRR